MDIVLAVALSQLGVPYKWGGSNPIDGFDCSGYVQWILRGCGIAPPKDMTAQQLYDFYQGNAEQNTFKIGSLAFYGQSVVKITHVGMMLDPYRVIEAAGGNHLTLTRDDAARQNASVRVSILHYRPDLVTVIKPRYSPIGCY